MRRMFNGILSDVIGRKGHRSETGNGKEEKRSDNCGGDICADSLSERSMSQDAASVFERHVTHHDDHVLRMRDPTALSTSSSTHALQSVTCGKCERDTVPVAKDADVSTPVSQIIEIKARFAIAREITTVAVKRKQTRVFSNDRLTINC